jgi:hypothetical protein
MAQLAKVSSFTIRSWIKKHNIQWRSISESLLIQSDLLSQRAKQTWSDPAKRAKQSETMKQVQSARKKELSKSSKENWRNNRNAIITGIRQAAKSAERNQKIATTLKQLWQNENYRRKISEAILKLWQTPEFRNIIQSTHTGFTSKSAKKLWLDPKYRETIIAKNKHRCSNPAIIQQMSKISTTLWQNKKFRQKTIAALQTAKPKISEAIREKWQNQEYRDKFATGINKEQFITRSIAQFGDRFNYDNTRLKNWKTKIEVQCSICKHQFNIYPQSHIENGYCPKCNTSQEQRQIANLLTNTPHQLNNRQIIKPLELDIYLPNHNIAIEHHGLYWHSYNSHENRQEKYRHQTKAQLCLEKGIKLYQFFDFEWYQKRNIIESMINNAIGNSTPLNARNMNIVHLDQQQSKEFFTTNHLSGHRYANITIGLQQNNQTHAAISFNKYRVE